MRQFRRFACFLYCVLPALCLAPISGRAESVTVYGTVDAFIASEHDDAGGTVRVGSGGSRTSALGFRAEEDLGDGWGIRAVLEAPLGVDTGTSRTMGIANGTFSQNAYLALTSSRYGTFSAGRQCTPAFFTLFYADPLHTNERLSLLTRITVATEGQGDRIAGIPGRYSNTVSWRSSPWNGFSFHLMHGFGEAQTDSKANDMDAAAIYYQAGKLYIGGSWTEIYDNPAGAVPAVATRHPALGVSYDFGTIVLYGSWDRSIAPRAAGAHDADNVQISAAMKLDENNQVIVQVATRKVADIDSGADGLMLGFDHFMSKRTLLYVRVGEIRNKGTSRLGLDDSTPLAGGDSRLMGVGIRHNF